jgi:hypothetical protein
MDSFACLDALLLHSVVSGTSASASRHRGSHDHVDQVPDDRRAHRPGVDVWPLDERAAGGWAAHPGERLKLSLDWDTWLICAYAPLFALLCWIAASHLAPTMPKLAAAGWVLAVLQLLAGVLDFIENAAVGKMIDAGSARQPWPLVTFAAAGTKWLLIAAFLLFGAFALGHWLWGLRR